MGRVRVFGEGDLQAVLSAHLRQARAEVDAQREDYTLNVNHTQYLDYLLDRYRAEPLNLDFDNVYVTDSEAMIPIEDFPNGGFIVGGGEPGRKFRNQVVTYHVPFTGDAALARYQPSRGIASWTTPVDVRETELSFDIPNFYDRPEDVKREADQILSRIRTQAENVDKEVEEFNRRLAAEVGGIIAARKADVLKQRNMLEALGVPVKRQSMSLPSFSVPVKRKVIAVKPTASAEKFTPEPAILLEDYRGILDVIHDLGVEMERHPSIYDGKHEESLRDLFIMQLSPHFASVTGETFNKAGKTDILIRHDGANLFVGECKFWKGKKGFLETIDQILGYLTWRDSKAAIICFVRNREFSTVIERIKEATPEHGSFVKLHDRPKPGWLQYEFNLRGDSSRPVHLAVLCFHLPPGDAGDESGSGTEPLSE